MRAVFKSCCWLTTALTLSSYLRLRSEESRFQSTVSHRVNIMNRRPRLKPLLMRRVVTDSFDHFDPTLQ